jgi:hypothetical protein
VLMYLHTHIVCVCVCVWEDDIFTDHMEIIFDSAYWIYLPWDMVQLRAFWKHDVEQRLTQLLNCFASTVNNHESTHSVYNHTVFHSLSCFWFSD